MGFAALTAARLSNIETRQDTQGEEQKKLAISDAEVRADIRTIKERLNEMRDIMRANRPTVLSSGGTPKNPK